MIRRRFHLFPVQHELRRRKEIFKNALKEISAMREPFISVNSGACDGINYWDLASNFAWDIDFIMSSYTKNFAAIIIQRSFRKYKESSVLVCCKVVPNILRPTKSSLRSKVFRYYKK